MLRAFFRAAAVAESGLDISAGSEENPREFNKDETRDVVNLDREAN